MVLYSLIILFRLLCYQFIDICSHPLHQIFECEVDALLFDVFESSYFFSLRKVDDLRERCPLLDTLHSKIIVGKDQLQQLVLLVHGGVGIYLMESVLVEIVLTDRFADLQLHSVIE